MTTTTATYTAEQIEAIGGNRWTSRTGTVRVYLNNWPALVGFEISRYKTGNINGATLAGQDISNGKAGQLSTAKVYWEDGVIFTNLDALADQIRVAVPGTQLVETLKSEIARLVAEKG